MAEYLVFTFAFAAAAAGVAVVRRFSGRLGLLDVPNERSSHSVPTPRGGGLAIVSVTLLLYLAIGAAGILTVNWSFFTGAFIVAAVSYLDDLFSLPAWVRLAAHLCAALVLIAGNGPVETTYFPIIQSSVHIGQISNVVWLIWIVWMVNAYNFMDGIDGIAGAQGVLAGLCWTVVGAYFGDASLFFLGGIISLSCLGFLVHNWSPAAIFMGDVGSAFLGFSLAAMPLIADGPAKGSGWLLLASLSFLWLFFFDTVYTFIRRAAKGEKVWLAHRGHLYQRMVISGSGHGKVTLVYASLTVVTSVSFFIAFWIRGNSELLLLSTYVGSAVFILFAAVRKKH